MFHASDHSADFVDLKQERPRLLKEWKECGKCWFWFTEKWCRESVAQNMMFIRSEETHERAKEAHAWAADDRKVEVLMGFQVDFTKAASVLSFFVTLIAILCVSMTQCCDRDAPYPLLNVFILLFIGINTIAGVICLFPEAAMWGAISLLVLFLAGIFYRAHFLHSVCMRPGLHFFLAQVSSTLFIS